VLITAPLVTQAKSLDHVKSLCFGLEKILFTSKGFLHVLRDEDSPDSPLPPTSVDDDGDGISEHRLAPLTAHYRE